ncbi:MAG: helix-turn-helix domain-containing protein [Saprospiraceae bacterium]|nr:helix-turn-helix domain-containing protein [Saprospiraceae bacterium]
MKLVEFKRPDGKGLNIEIIKYQTDDRSRTTSSDRHRHEFHSIFFIQSGESIQEIDFQEFAIAANQVMIIPKGSVHWEKEQRGLSGYVILFNEDFFSEIQSQLLNGFLQYAIALRKLLIPVDSSMAGNIEAYFKLLDQEQEGPENQNQTFILQNLMLALLNKLEGLIQHLPDIQSFISSRSPFQRFTALVEKHYTQHKSIEFYTNSLQITPRKLNEILKQLTGHTATNFLIERIIMEAKRELCFSEKSVKEIAHQLGYESQYYFSRLFKKRTQLSPEKFRALFAE